MYQGLSALISEEFGHFRGNGRHDRGVEERVESGEQERADNDRDEDLHAGIDVAFPSVVGESGLRAESGGGELVLDGVDDLSHVNYLISFIFLFGLIGFSGTIALSITSTPLAFTTL